MNLKTRNFLFYGLTLLFFISGLSIILYSNGWRFDLETLKISQVGAILLKATPEDVVISIDKANFKFQSGFLRSGTLITNLFPKIYNVRISKENYQTWNKQLTVQPSLVTEAPTAILLPEKFKLSTTTPKERASFLTNEKALASRKRTNILKFALENPKLKNSFGTVRDTQFSESGEFISILNAQNQLYLLDKNSEEHKLISENALGAYFSPDSKKIAFIGANQELTIHPLSADSNNDWGSQKSIFRLGAIDPEKLFWHKNSEYIFIKYPSDIYLLETSSLPPINLQLVDSGNSKYYYKPEENSLYLLKANILYKLSLE